MHITLQKKLHLEKRHFPVVVIEAGDGAGKTTVANILEELLHMQLLSSPTEPYNIPSLRNVVHSFGPAQDLLFYLSSNLHASHCIKMAKEKDQGMLLVRHITSTAVYNTIRPDRNVSVAESIPNGLKELIAPELAYPDIYIYIYVSPQAILQRLDARGTVLGGNTDDTAKSLALSSLNQDYSPLDTAYFSAFEDPFLRGDALYEKIDTRGFPEDKEKNILHVTKSILAIISRKEFSDEEIMSVIRSHV